MEYKALSRGEGSSSAASGKRTKDPQAKRAHVAKRKVVRKSKTIATTWGAVYLDAPEFAEFEKCIQTPQRPTQSIIKGAELIRSLYKSR